MDVQVCQRHGHPDDIVICPFTRCQSGKVPQWSGYGMPAGTRQCTVCNGTGKMKRAAAAEVFLPPDVSSNPPCICWALTKEDN